MYQLIASDLDGTLLNADHNVDSFTAATLQQLDAQGVRFVIATGRHYLDVRGIRDVLGIRAWLISSNGARVHDGEDRLVLSGDIAPDIARQLLQPDIAAGAHLNVYLDDAWLAEGHGDWMGDMYDDSGFTYQIANLQAHSGEGIAKVLYVGDHDHLLTIEAKLNARFGDQLYVTFSLHDCLEVMAAGVSKGHALKAVLNALTIHPQQCAAFGDGANDIHLLEAAGHPFVMANASARLVAAVPHARQIGHHAEAGVAHFLRDAFRMSEDI
ncbi:Cof-type HAD-IIB family hydrolase [Burkholderiaceae bacterium DAT-1]|nr:Cof-type HAD-IIB family hydrolase [Burkholderiaceae bacterium DAT-1]